LRKVEIDKQNSIVEINEKFAKGEINLTEEEIENYKAQFEASTEKLEQELEKELKIVKVEKKVNNKGKELISKKEEALEIVKEELNALIIQKTTDDRTQVEKALKENKIETNSAITGASALLGGGIGGTVGMVVGTFLFPGLGTAAGASLGASLCGATTGTSISRVSTKNQEKENREEIIKEVGNFLTKIEQREETVKNNLIKYLQLTREIMNEKDQEIEKIRSENRGLIGQLNTANTEAKKIQEERAEANKKKELVVEKLKSLQSKEQVDLQN
jgi:hypothetical protein